MNAELFYSIKPNLSDDHNAELLEFLITRGYNLSSIFGDHIALLCRIENTKDGREEIPLSSNLSISTEDILSESIEVFDASDRLRNALLQLNPDNSFTLIDPYIFPSKYDDDYIEFFFSVFGKIFERIKFATFITKKNCNKGLECEISKRIKGEYCVSFNINYTSVFHDRFWIVDNKKGLFIGTSLNGIGKKYTLFDQLQEQDVIDIVKRCIDI